MTKEQIIEILRLAYLNGGHDAQEDNFHWCQEGSRECAEDMFTEFSDEGLIDIE